MFYAQSTSAVISGKRVGNRQTGTTCSKTKTREGRRGWGGGGGGGGGGQKERKRRGTERRL